ncbi:helix-turn-helix domain-containing protein [Plantactinospora soyae]|uniref:helix-turn-helix domain-containing protein n=1 Tax=Plantactinospora soyae TaxID=1544732 RepID=UPI00178AE757
MALLDLTGAERDALEALTRRRSAAQALATRARIVLVCARGLSNSEVSRLLGVSLPAVGTWRSRFVVHRVDGLHDEPRPSRPRQVSDADVGVTSLFAALDRATGTMIGSVHRRHELGVVDLVHGLDRRRG